MSAPNMSPHDMEEIKGFIRRVGQELSATVATSKMEAIARVHVQEEFRGLTGVDLENAKDVREFMENMAFLHKFRALSEKVGATIILTVVTLTTVGVAGIIWSTMKGD